MERIIKRSFFSSHIVQILALALLVAATAVLALPIQRRIVARMEQLQNDIIAYLEDVTGREIRYGGFSPSILRFIEIRDMRILSRLEPERELVQVNRVRVYYSLFRFLKGETARAFTRISLESSEFVIDVEKDHDLITFATELLTSGTPGSNQSEGREILISGKDLSLVLVGTDGTVRFSQVFFDLETGYRDYEYQLNGRLSADGLDFPGSVSRIDAQVIASGSAHRTLDQATMRVAFSNLRTNAFSVIDQTFQVHFRERTWTLRKIQDRLPVDISVVYRAGDGDLLFALVADQFVPSSYVSFEAEDPLPPGFLDSAISGRAEASFSPRLNAVEYSGDLRVVLASPVLPTRLTMSSQFSGNDKLLRISSLTVDSPIGRASFVGDVRLPELFPDGILELDSVRYPTDRPVTGTIHATMTEGDLLVSSDWLDVGTHRVHRVEGRLGQAGPLLDFGVAFDIGGASAEREGPRNVRIDGSFSRTALEIDASFRRAPAAALYAAAVDSEPTGLIAGELERMVVDAEAFIRTDFDRYSYSIFSFTAGTAEGEETIELVMSGNESTVNVASLVSNWRGIEVEATARVNLGRDGVAGFSSTLRLFEESYPLTGSYSPGTNLSVSGPHELAIRVDFPSDSRSPLYRFSLAAHRFPIVTDRRSYQTNLDLSGDFRGVDDWRVESRSASISPVPGLTTIESELVVAGELTPRGGVFQNIVVSDQFSTVSGTGSLDLRSTSPLSFAMEAGLSSAAGDEQYSLRVDLQDGRVEGDGRFADVPVLRFLDGPVAGTVSGHAEASGRLPVPDIRVEAEMANGLLNADPVSFNVSAFLNQERARLEAFEAQYLSNRITNGTGSLSFQDGEFDITGNFSGSIQNNRLLAVTSVVGRFAAPLSRTDLTRLSELEYTATAALRQLRLAQISYDDWEFDVQRTAGVLSFAGGREDSISGTVADDGSFRVSLREPLPLAMEAEGRVHGSSLEASLRNVYLDMEGVESVVTIPFFNVTAGQARGNLYLEGPLNDPDIYGELQGRDLLARVPVVPEVIGPFTARLKFEGKTLMIEDAVMRAGAAVVDGRVNFTLDHWLPQLFDIELTTKNAAGIHIRYNFGGIDVDGYANGVLRVFGDAGAAQIEGTLTVHNTDIMIRQQETAKNSSAMNLIVDLSFVTARRVAFLWPNPNFPIFRSFADTGQELRLRSNTMRGTYSIRGDIRVRGGEIFYFQRNFYLKQGQIQFNENQEQFDPLISARAETRDISAEGEHLTIYLVVDDQPFSRFNPRFESDPSMSPIDILAYLGQDIITEGARDQFGLSSALRLTTDVLGQFAIFRNVENRVRDILKLDLFSLRTQILQNIISDTVLQNGDAASRAGPSLGRYLDNTTLFLGKYFGNDLFLEAMVRLRANQTIVSSLNTAGDLYVDSEIRLEWRTPLFLLELSLLPDFADLLTSMTNTSIGLSWGFSY